MTDLLDKLEQALEHAGNTHALPDVAQAIDRGTAKLWAHEKALVVTEIEQYPRRRVASVWLAGGDLRTITDEIAPQIYDWAREMGCDSVVLVGRKGWKRALAADGWADTEMVLMEKKL